MSLRGDNSGRVRGWLLQFKVLFGLTFSVVTGFLAGYFLGGPNLRAYLGLAGAIAGFFAGIIYLVKLVGQDQNGKKRR